MFLEDKVLSRNILFMNFYYCNMSLDIIILFLLGNVILL